ncbi:MAG: single-stranded DNA-binding protein [Bacteroidota bacterium]|jgi:single-strand DNA-binding protein
MKTSIIEKSEAKEAINKVILTGNLGKDPLLDQVGRGQKIVRFSLATNQDYKNNKGETVKNTLWHNVIAWGDLAEEINQKLKKGSRITVEGRINYNVYTDKSGSKRSFTDIIANNVRMHETNEK